MERIASRALLLVVNGPPRLAASLLAERYPQVVCRTAILHLAIGPGETPESVLAYCQERHIGVLASCVVSRIVDDGAVSADASPSHSALEVAR